MSIREWGNMSSARHLPAVFCVLLFLPCIASAQAAFSEIMYDLDGGDTDREWIEVKNEGSDTVDLSLWKLFEGDSNHKLTAFGGDARLTAGSYAVIATKPETFLKDWPSFSGTLFGSSFSLKNSGEELILRDSSLKDSDKVAYTPDWGGKGDGNSLQKTGGKWIAARPTPGTVNASSAVPPAVPAAATPASSSAPVSSPESTTLFPSVIKSASPETQMSALISARPDALVGTDALFKGQAFGVMGKPLANARYFWNFGDGGTTEGASVVHAYRHPGSYAVVLDVGSGEFSASARMTIAAAPAQVSITAVVPGEKGFIEIFNNGSADLDLSSWQIALPDQRFVFPKDTFVLSGKKIVFGSEATGLLVKEQSPVSLLYPNGDLAYRYEKAGEEPAPAPHISEAASSAVSFQRTPTVASSFPGTPSRGSISSLQSGSVPRVNHSAVSSGATASGDASDTAMLASSAEQSANAGDSAASSGFPYAWLLGAAGIVILGVSATLRADGRGGVASDISIIE